MFQNNVRKLIRSIWLQVAVLVAIFTITRLISIFYIGDWGTLQTLWNETLAAFFVGFRFDLRASTIAFAPLLFIGILLAPSRLFNYFKSTFLLYAGLIFFLATAGSIGNYYYYKTYANHFDIFIFGLVEDDTTAILTTLWQDYPIMEATLATWIIVVLAIKLTQKIGRKIDAQVLPDKGVINTSIMLVVTVLVYLFFARGSLGTFPLKQYHANVSSYEVLNKFTPNALLALDWARSQHRKNQDFHKVSKADYQQQMLKVLAQKEPVYRTLENAYLAENKPHVVFALMESMGTNLLIEDDSSKNDLLGALRPHYNEDFHFERFLAGTAGTIDTIAMMLFYSINPTISHGLEQKTKLPHTAFEPYKKAGYKVVYITGGSPLWRNLKYYMPLQGVDSFYSENDIYDAIPEAKQSSNTWGALDEHTFAFAQNILEQSAQPIVMMIQTQTNHPPYEIPPHYIPKPITVSQVAINKLQMSEEKVRKIHETYQYAADALGQFISAIKGGLLADNTLIAATGDHRLREYSVNYPNDLANAHSVPFYIHIPKAILARTSYVYDPRRIGSHRDIFPTLYAFSLSNAEYHSLGGRNMLAVNDSDEVYAYGNQLTFTPQGISYNANANSLYPWSEQARLAVLNQEKNNPKPELEKEYIRLQKLFINAQIKGFKCAANETCDNRAADNRP